MVGAVAVARRGGLVVLIASGIVTTSGAPALAHSFLTRTSPEPGGRLSVAPTEIVLDFSEPLDGSAVVTMTTVDGDDVALADAATDGDGSLVRAAAPLIGDGAYRVAWRVTSLDGHTAEGEFAFAVGTDLPAGMVADGARNAGIAWGEAAVALLLVGGSAVAMGGLASERWIWRRPAPAATWVAAASALAAIGAVATVVLRLDAGDILDRPGDWSAAFAVRANQFILLAAGALVVAALLARRTSVRRSALAWIVLAVVAVVAAGHASTTDRWWARPATTLHVLAAGLWLGALVQVVHGARASTQVDDATHRYSRTASVAVAVGLPFGVAAAAALIDSPGRILATTYGRILAVKVVLVAVAVGLALLARRRAFPRTGARRAVDVRLITLEAVALAGVLASSAALATTPPTSDESFTLLPESLADPTLWMADLAGHHQVLLGAAPDRLRIQVTPPDDEPADDLDIDVTAIEPDDTTVELHPRTCGPGCVEIIRRWQEGTTTVRVAVRGGTYSGGVVELPVSWPPGPDAAATLDSVIATTRAAVALEVTEIVSSGPGATSEPYPLQVAGDTYVVAQPWAGGGTDVHRQPTSDGLVTITFVVSGAGTWHQLWLDREGQLRRAVLVDPGHRVDHTIEPGR